MKPLLTTDLTATYGEYRVRLTDVHRIKQFTHFAAEVYNAVAQRKKSWEPITPQTLRAMEIEDRLHFPNGYFFELLDDCGRLIGTTKITLKTDELKFPIETCFGVNIVEQLNNLGRVAHEIWHFGRLAVSPAVTDRNALFTLLFHSLTIVSRYENNILIAECDADLCRKLEIIGIRVYKAGLPMNYVGSPTFPVIATARDLRKFLKIAQTKLFNETVNVWS